MKHLFLLIMYSSLPAAIFGQDSVVHIKKEVLAQIKTGDARLYQGYLRMISDSELFLVDKDRKNAPADEFDMQFSYHSIDVMRTNNLKVARFSLYASVVITMATCAWVAHSQGDDPHSQSGGTTATEKAIGGATMGFLIGLITAPTIAQLLSHRQFAIHRKKDLFRKMADETIATYK